jgi:signal transduction histidine kinase
VKTETDLAALCQEIAGELRAVHPDRAFEVVCEGDPVGSCDSARLGQVLSNLMGNAVQYGRASSPVTVGVAGGNSDTVTVTVHNLGTPISAEKQKVIFQSWMRGQEVQAEQGAHLGLGLYIAKLIAEAHGGDISVASEEHAGTSFPCVSLAVDRGYEDTMRVRQLFGTAVALGFAGAYRAGTGSG